MYYDGNLWQYGCSRKWEVLQWLTGGTTSQRLVAILSIMMVNHTLTGGRTRRSIMMVNHRVQYAASAWWSVVAGLLIDTQ